MAKRYFGTKRRTSRDTGLFKIILVLAVLVGGAYFGGQYLSSLGSWFASPEPADAAQVDRDWQQEAKTAIESGDLAAAESAIEAWQSASNGPLPLDAQFLQAEIAEKKGASQDAISILEPALERARNSAEFPAAAIALAKAYEAGGKHDEALALYTEVRDRAPSPFREQGAVALAEELQRAGKFTEALPAFEQVVAKAEPDSEAWNQAIDALGAINVELIFSPRETADSRYYVIEPGDSITEIGNTLNTTQGLLMRANDITAPERIRVGQRLKYTPKDFRIIIERSTCRLFLLDTAGIFKRYSVGLGMPGYETAPGKYTIGNKQKDPTWFKPGAEPVPPNDPENELGTRWMPLIPLDAGLPTDLGIHGTIEPESIGKFQSHGCPRMQKEDVEELYDLVVRSTPVEIVEKIDWPSVLESAV
ncbi:MAG: L,D-transpeptidase family protein [Candidatus Hydrogenedens sp.]|nr:L,D-transpeptidase family protein [Candidatus Hydrogenedens sp.]